jgi:hypothetical protein
VPESRIKQLRRGPARGSPEPVKYFEVQSIATDRDLEARLRAMSFGGGALTRS